MAARACGHRLLAGAAPRPRLGHGLPRRHADGRRPRGAAPPQARPAGADPHGPRRRLQSRPGMSRLDSLRTRLFAATFLAVVLSIGLSLAIGAVLTRREGEKAARRAPALPLAPGRARGEGEARRLLAILPTGEGAARAQGQARPGDDPDRG